ncbi:MAG: (d)CMP kinase [Acidimicrobiia bacterium]
MSAGQDIIAIDGPAGSGKSTVARRVADRLALPVLDTGAMYRAVTVVVLERGIDPADGNAVAAAAESCDLEVGTRVLCNGLDVTEAIRTPEVDAHVSAVARNPLVRSILIAQQRKWGAAHAPAVAEGRDMGAVVFPDARVKIFLTASDSERARRRQIDRGPAEHAHAAVQADINRRDQADVPSTLEPAPSAVVVDTTELTIDEVVESIVTLVEKANA